MAKAKQKFVTATPRFQGKLLVEYITRREITDKIEADIVGECIRTATDLAWGSGLDPTTFEIVVEYS